MAGNQEKSKQKGFFISSDGGAFHLHPEEGDRMIKKKMKKEPKHGSITPFSEVMSFYRLFQKRAKILEENGVYEDDNGTLFIQRNGRWSPTSTEEATGIFKTLTGINQGLPEIPRLSDAAMRLKFKLEKDKLEKLKGGRH